MHARDGAQQFIELSVAADERASAGDASSSGGDAANVRHASPLARTR
jgi:hypothetical protein